MPELAARAQSLLPYRLRAGRSGAQPSGPGSPKERSGQTDGVQGDTSAIMSIGREPDIGRGPPPQGTGTGAHSSGVWPISAQRKNITPQITPKTRLGARGRLGQFGATHI